MGLTIIKQTKHFLAQSSEFFPVNVSHVNQVASPRNRILAAVQFGVMLWNERFTPTFKLAFQRRRPWGCHYLKVVDKWKTEQEAARSKVARGKEGTWWQPEWEPEGNPWTFWVVGRRWVRSMPTVPDRCTKSIGKEAGVRLTAAGSIRCTVQHELSAPCTTSWRSGNHRFEGLWEAIVCGDLKYVQMVRLQRTIWIVGQAMHHQFREWRQSWGTGNGLCCFAPSFFRIIGSGLFPCWISCMPPSLSCAMRERAPDFVENFGERRLGFCHVGICQSSFAWVRRTEWG